MDSSSLPSPPPEERRPGCLSLSGSVLHVRQLVRVGVICEAEREQQKETEGWRDGERDGEMGREMER